MNPVEFSIFSSRVASICDEMGAMLKRAALSPNIKDRLDFSCAIFDQSGGLIAQAAHIPVHLGSMAYAMAEIVATMSWQKGDMVVLNDPYQGGTHLPDVTLVAPVFVEHELVAFVVNRAHHANIGADVPGSMPLSEHIREEGLLIEPSHLIKAGQWQSRVLASLCADGLGSENAVELGDFTAQVSANRVGVQRMVELVAGSGVTQFKHLVNALNDYSFRLAKQSLQRIPNGSYSFHDILEDDGLGTEDIIIQAQVTVLDGTVAVNFNGTSPQVRGNLNCPLAVVAAAVFYVFRCLMPPQVPVCAGVFKSIAISAPYGSLLNARYPAAVAAGNVETSTRIVDVILGALAQAIPEAIPAASNGSMNNVALGVGRTDGSPWDYYETIGGGMGASIVGAGSDAVHTHMTNTLNTPIESLESHYPLRVIEYSIRRGSGGAGRHRGGNGIRRTLQFLAHTSVTLLTERRRLGPWGLDGGMAGSPGLNLLNDRELPAKTSFKAQAGDRLTIATPGGGGWGKQ